jgi:hypothetical protein
VGLIAAGTLGRGGSLDVLGKAAILYFFLRFYAISEAKLKPACCHAIATNPYTMSDQRLYGEIVSYYNACFRRYFKLDPRSATAASILYEMDKSAKADHDDVLEASGNTTMLYWLLVRALAVAHADGKGDALYEALEAGLIRKLFSFQVAQEEFPGLSRPSDLATLLTPFQAYRKKLLHALDVWNDGELYHFAFQQFVDSIVSEVRRRHKNSYAAIQKRCAQYKEELIAAAWHPTRVARWLEAGAELDTL